MKNLRIPLTIGKIKLNSSCLFGTEIRQINMLSKRLENRSEEYYIYHKAKVDLIWITGEKKPLNNLQNIYFRAHNEALHKADQKRHGKDNYERRNTSSDQV